MNTVLVILTAGLAAALVGSWIRWVSWRSTLGRRLGRAVLQLDRKAAEGEENLDRLVDRLEDTAERSSIERNLVAEERSRLQHAINELRSGLVVVDQDGDLVARNRIAEQFVSSRDSSALVGAAVVDLLESARRGRGGERVVNLTEPPARVVRVTAQALSSGERPLGAVAVIEDHTESARVDRVRKEFVADLSHELRTPLGAISVLAHTLVGEPDEGVRSGLVGRITSESGRVGQIIDDLLELSRLELGASPREDLVDVEALLSEAVDLVRVHADKREVKVLRLPAAHALRVVGDRDQLLRAVSNLLENAVRYSNVESLVEVAAQAVGEAAQGEFYASSYAASNHVEIVVRDQGMGIPQHEHSRIFERFYRTDEARSRSTDGSGLGLSIVRHVVSNHGGQIRVRSREGEGSTFTLRLPGGVRE
jgi:two-component system, OmpR family, sensor histidine kinase SenX3